MVIVLGENGAHARRLVGKVQARKHARDFAINHNLKMAVKTVLPLEKTRRPSRVNLKPRNAQVSIK